MISSRRPARDRPKDLPHPSPEGRPPKHTTAPRKASQSPTSNEAARTRTVSDCASHRTVGPRGSPPKHTTAPRKAGQRPASSGPENRNGQRLRKPPHRGGPGGRPPEHMAAPREAARKGSEHAGPARGGGGNRTRVLQYITRASPGAACCVFLSPGSHAGKLPTGSAAVGVPPSPAAGLDGRSSSLMPDTGPEELPG
jgi:hypothetical protein